ncbi:PA2c domain-containing protein [Caerostris extrusa]|uniref:PA2c domain-containing protein n=1 Tax=Caerostris extrusa TaxID=172846 RepID=A0AAV4MEA1_CAEEX|nr:PA2c domain-containing protein [Caerostris extrusa]
MGEEFSNMKMISLTHPAPSHPCDQRGWSAADDPQFFYNRSSGLAGTPPARFRRFQITYASMISCRLLQWVTLFLLTTATFTESRRPPWLRTIGNDFVCTRVLPDGEVERRIQKGRISAIETTVELAPEPTDSPFSRHRVRRESPKS